MLKNNVSEFGNRVYRKNYNKGMVSKLPLRTAIKENFIKPNYIRGYKNLVVLGAGYGGLTAALRLEKLFRNFPLFKVHLIDKYPYHTIKTQLHEAAVRKAEVSIPIYKILKGKNIQFHLGEVENIDIQNKNLQLSEENIPFQFLVIAIGSKVNYYNIPGMAENSYPLQTLQDADKIYKHISNICASSSPADTTDSRKEHLRFVIGGGGLSGVEFAGELADHTAKCLSNFNKGNINAEIIIIEAADRLVPFMEESFSSRIQKKLIDKGVKVLTRSKIKQRSIDEIILEDGRVIRSRNFIWTGGIRISDLIKRGGLETSPVGRLIVDESLQAVNENHIYAIGDSANAINPNTGKPVPAAAQFALQQGRLAAENIYAEIFGRAKKKYYPKVLGEVVSLGKHLAVGWLALPFFKKVTFVGFLGRLLKAAIREKHIILLRKESHNWITY